MRVMELEEEYDGERKSLRKVKIQERNACFEKKHKGVQTEEEGEQAGGEIGYEGEEQMRIIKTHI